MTLKNGHGDVRREALAMALAKGLNVLAAATEAKISEKTAHRWTREEGFGARVHRIRDAMFSEAVGALATVNRMAAVTLAQLLKSPDEKVRLAASKAILETGAALHEKAGLARQVSELREAVDELTRQRNQEADGTGESPASEPEPDVEVPAADPAPAAAAEPVEPVADAQDEAGSLADEVRRIVHGW
jgi:hypothetical protein